VLVRIPADADAAAVASAIRGLLPSGTQVRIRSGAQTPYLRLADGVLPPQWEKVYFGEFAARPTAGGAFQIDPRWVAQHVTSARVPLLGIVRCNRALIRPLRRALAELRRARLASLVHRSDYGGCFVPRVIRGGSDLSHHTWGSAIDVNVSSNRLGQPPDQDHRLVRAFGDAGFVWGGRFLRPDGMHFEYGCPQRFPIRPWVEVPVRLLRVSLCPGR
jgi:hypothetical protein